MSTPFIDPEDPESQGPTVPATYTAACQVRQYGAGGAKTTGVPRTVLNALANPPAAMVTAAGKVLTKPVVTPSDLNVYYSVANANALNAINGGTP